MKQLIFILVLVITPFTFAVPLQETQNKVGDAKFKYLFWKIYKSSLYTAEKNYISIDQEITLSIDYQRNIPKSRIINATIGQWEHLNYPQEKIDKWSKILSEVFVQIKKNDNLSFYKNENGLGEFYYNGKLIAKIEDKEFSESFLNIWLSENTSQPKLRKKLIGG